MKTLFFMICFGAILIQGCAPKKDAAPTAAVKPQASEPTSLRVATPVSPTAPETPAQPEALKNDPNTGIAIYPGAKDGGIQAASESLAGKGYKAQVHVYLTTDSVDKVKTFYNNKMHSQPEVINPGKPDAAWAWTLLEGNVTKMVSCIVSGSGTKIEIGKVQI